MIKRVLFVLLCVVGAYNIYAQNKPFEGDVVYESYTQLENLSKKKQKRKDAGIVTITKFSVKNGRVHSMDKNDLYHSVIDIDGKINIGWIVPAKMGMDIGLVAPEYAFGELQRMKIIRNSFAKRSTVQTILGHPCTLYDGQIICKDISFNGDDLSKNNEEYAVIYRYDVKAYLADDMLAPSCYKGEFMTGSFSSLMPNVPLKIIVRQTQLNDKYQVGNHSTSYYEYDAVEITPRVVGDEEFDIPDYDYFTEPMPDTDDMNFSKIFKLIKFMKRLKKWQKTVEKYTKLDESAKTTGIHYKTDGEWEF